MALLSKCPICNKEAIISKNLFACVDCIRLNRNNVIDKILEIHRKSRRVFSLPEKVPVDGTVNCGICGNNCKMKEGEYGFCGLRKNVDGKLFHEAGDKNNGYLNWYYDILPTNCVADWVCEGSKNPGKKNLAVFYRSCSFNCLFCQNWHFREYKSASKVSDKQLASFIDENTFCICYFGGDPSTQIFHAVSTSEKAIAKKKDVRICWETNGNISNAYIDDMIRLSLDSGGIIKFDLKTFDERLNIALCGVTNKNTLRNFEYVADYIDRRANPPLLVASTLLVPGYIDEKEVFKIAKFIARIDKNIPYILLAFYPTFFLSDLPRTPKKLADNCYRVSIEAGLVNVRIGNIHLLW